jgi:hypothetical protein
VKWISSVSNAAVSVIKTYHCLIREDAGIKKKTATLTIQLTFFHGHSYKILAHFWGPSLQKKKLSNVYLSSLMMKVPDHVYVFRSLLLQ